jgi:hypothetical protein
MARIGRAPDVAVGEHWAYRARWSDPLDEVAVLRVGTKTPRRALVRWVADSFEGQQDWVPPARLRAPWSEVERSREHERRWDAALPRADEYPEVIHSAIESAFDVLIDPSVASLGYNAEAGVLRVHDATRLAAKVKLSPEDLSPDLSFADDGDLVVPTPTALMVAQRAVAGDPEAILRYVEHQEAEARREAVHGRYYPGRGRDGDFSVSAETCRAEDEERHAPVRAVLREWAGAEAVDRRAELTAAREEAVRLANLAERALRALRESGHVRAANRIERELGTVRSGVRKEE